MSTLLKADEIRISERDKENLFSNIATMSRTELGSGKAIFRLLKLEFSVIEISDMLNIRPATMSYRLIEYLRKKENSFKEFEFLTKEIKGLHVIEIAYKFCLSNKDLNGFCALQGIKKKTFLAQLDKVKDIPYFSDLLKEREKRLDDISNRENFNFLNRTSITTGLISKAGSGIRIC